MTEKKYTFSFHKRGEEVGIKYPNRFCRYFKLRGKLYKTTIWLRTSIQTDKGPKEWEGYSDIIQLLEPTACMFQLEQGTYPTSFIATGGNYVTRTADKVTYEDGCTTVMGNKIVDGYLVTEPSRTNYILNQEDKSKEDEDRLT